MESFVQLMSQPRRHIVYVEATELRYDDVDQLLKALNGFDIGQPAAKTAEAQ